MLTPRLIESLVESCRQYQAARQAVLADWQPDCGCDDIGAYPQCESCPHRAVFRDLLKAKVLAQQASHQTKS